MERAPVSSTNVVSIGYDSPTQTLEIEFTNGSIYQYFDVPEAAHSELLASPSIGKTVNEAIKKNYRFSKQ